MLNYLWGFMIVIGILYAAFTGNLPAVTNAALDSSKEAVTLCITMMGVMSLWVGLMRIAENCGIIRAAARMLNPLLRFMFPNIPKEHKANEYISTNIIANVFGLGWAATPAGLKAMESMGELNNHSKVASKEIWLDKPRLHFGSGHDCHLLFHTRRHCICQSDGMPARKTVLHIR